MYSGQPIVDRGNLSYIWSNIVEIVVNEIGRSIYQLSLAIFKIILPFDDI